MILLIFIFGLIIGSFLNVVIFRLRNTKPIVKSRSCCQHCSQKLKWYELIPLFSFIIQLGRCRTCQQRISWQYSLVELVTGLLFVLSYLQFTTFNLLLVRDFFVIGVLVVIFVYDLRWQLIPDKVTLPAIGVVILINLIVVLISDGSLVNWLVNLLIAIVVGGGFFLLQFVVSKGHWIGGGDIRLGVLMGVVLGWPLVAWALMIAYVLGAVVATSLVLSKQKTWSSQVPFGTFLTVATFISLYWGDNIVAWYINLVV
jgi:prepilin signal peptidase PulO-like enzyme (type II secretory pathway)